MSRGSRRRPNVVGTLLGQVYTRAMRRPTSSAWTPHPSRLPKTNTHDRNRLSAFAIMRL